MKDQGREILDYNSGNTRTRFFASSTTTKAPVDNFLLVLFQCRQDNRTNMFRQYSLRTDLYYTRLIHMR